MLPARPNDRSVLGLALALSLATAVSLGVTRFAYGLLLPTMRADLQWSYTLAGAMNTANALGYLLGALLSPALLRAVGVSRLLLASSAFASLFMGLSGFFTEAVPLLLQRALAGFASAFLLIAGSLLAARLVALQPRRGGLLLGLYYGGTGVGIVLSAWLVPALLQAAQQREHAPELVAHRQVDRVQALRAVERQPGDVALALEPDVRRLVGHRRLTGGSTRAATRMLHPRRAHGPAARSRECYSPVKRGARFSKNAASPSWWSPDAMASACE